MDDIRASLQRAIDIAGSQAALATLCGVGQQYISYCLKTGRITAETALRISKAVEGQVSVRELCPGLPWDVVTAEPAS